MALVFYGRNSASGYGCKETDQDDPESLQAPPFLESSHHVLQVSHTLTVILNIVGKVTQTVIYYLLHYERLAQTYGLQVYILSIPFLGSEVHRNNDETKLICNLRTRSSVIEFLIKRL